MATADIREALAEALHATAGKNHNLGEGPMRAVCQSAESHGLRADAILAALPPGSWLAGPEERAALDDGLALARLREWLLSRGDSMPWYQAIWDPTDIPSSPCRVIAGGADDSTSEPKWGGWGNTFIAAVDALLEADRG